MRRTRSSARREAEESGEEDVDAQEQQEEEEYAFVPPPAQQRQARAPPPPPPPPPPRRTNNNNVESVAAQTRDQTFHWTLTLLAPSGGSIQLAVTPNMSADTLGRCILQATYGCDPLEDADMQLAVCNTE